SPGIETTTFGPATQKAVRKFQEKHGLAQPGDPGYGYVGPKTRAKLQEVFGGVPSTSSGQAALAPASVPEATSQSQSVQQLLEQLQALQAQLNALQGQ
ncbi:MAG TPA: peptidoglycan-binding domain-containing protein, partial [Candidatus Paceibacterota bacterium]